MAQAFHPWRKRLHRFRTERLPDKATLLVAAIAGLVCAANAMWLWVNRHGGALDIDEAGYLSVSITDYHALRAGGLPALVQTVGRQPVQAPLVTVASAAVFLVLGRPSLMAAFSIQLAALFAVMLLTYSIAGRLAGRVAGVVAAISVGSTPIMLDYVHEYNFALPAAAFFTTAVWAVLRSRHLTSLRWAACWGAAIGAMVLSRTVTIAFLPGFVLLGVVLVAVSEKRARSAAGVAWGVTAAALVAGPWYVAQGASVWHYLTAFGYGPQAAAYGRERTLLSFTSWMNFAVDNLNQYIWLCLGLVLLSGCLALTFRVVSASRSNHRLNVRRVFTSPWWWLVLLEAEGLMALESSRDLGTGFLAPLVPVLFALSAGAVLSTLARRRILTAIATVAILSLSLPSYISKLALSGAAHAPTSVLMPGVGWVTVVDRRSLFDRYVADGHEANVSDPSGRRWVAANAALLTIAETYQLHHGGAGKVLFAFNQNLVNVNTFWLDELLRPSANSTGSLLTPNDTESAGAYAAQIAAIAGAGPALILLLDDPPNVFTPLLDQAMVMRAARQLGFSPYSTVGLPDGASIAVWAR